MQIDGKTDLGDIVKGHLLIKILEDRMSWIAMFIYLLKGTAYKRYLLETKSFDTIP